MSEGRSLFSPREVARHLRGIFFQGREASPLRLAMGLTRNCNLSCIFCWRKISQEQAWQDLDDAEVLRLVDEASMMGVRLLHIQGEGEPFLRAELCSEVMRRAKQSGLYGTITTNGTLLSGALLERMVRYEWDEIKISLDAPEASLHDYFRGKNGVFNKVTESIAALQELKNAHEAHRPIISLLYVVNALNYRKIPEMLSIMKDLSIDIINFFPVRIFADSAIDLALKESHREELSSIIDDLEKTGSTEGIRHNLHSFTCTSDQKHDERHEESLLEEPGQRESMVITCFLPWYNISMGSEGYVDCCDMTCDREMKFQSSGLREIWNSAYYRNLRTVFRGGRTLEKCVNCCMKGDIEDIRRSLMRDFRANL
jgi:MoaA/NifB/PqqE/SkfB family radical SAM enzyme